MSNVVFGVKAKNFTIFFSIFLKHSLVYVISHLRILIGLMPINILTDS